MSSKSSDSVAVPLVIGVGMFGLTGFAIYALHRQVQAEQRTVALAKSRGYGYYYPTQ